jgi:hypothetical protein
VGNFQRQQSGRVREPAQGLGLSLLLQACLKLGLEASSGQSSLHAMRPCPVSMSVCVLQIKPLNLSLLVLSGNYCVDANLIILNFGTFIRKISKYSY